MPHWGGVGGLEASLHRKPGLEVPLAGAARPGPISGPRRGRPQRTPRDPRLLRCHLGPHLGRPLTPGPNCPANREATEVLWTAQSVSLGGHSNVCDLGAPPPPVGNRSEEQTAAPTWGGLTGGRQITSGKPQIKKHIHLYVF